MKPVKITGHNELAEAFLELTTKGDSAYIMVVRRSGPFIGIGVLGGQVTYLKCGPNEGSEVLPVLRDIQPGDHFLFYPPRAEFLSPEVPDPERVLTALQKSGLKPGIAPSLQLRAEPTPAPSSTSSAPSGISREQLFEAVCPVFRQHIGPMTDILCDEALREMPQVVSQAASFDLVKNLARNLKDPKKFLEFKVAANDRVKALFK